MPYLDLAGSALVNIADAVDGHDALAKHQITDSSGASLIGFTQSGTGAVATTIQAWLRGALKLLDIDFGAIGDGTTDDLTPLTNFFNSALANPGVPHVMSPKTYACTGALPDINADNVIIWGAGVHRHDDGTITGTCIKYTGSAGATLQKITAVSGASNYRIANVTIQGVGYNCNNLAAVGLELLSARSCNLDILVDNATSSGFVIGVVASLVEGRDTQDNQIRFQGRQIEAASGVSIRLQGDSGANSSLNSIWADIQHKNASAIIEENADNNDWYYCRTYRDPAGSATYAVEWNAGASGAECARAERFHYLTSNLPSHAYGTETSTTPAHDILIYCLDEENSTPVPTTGTAASVYYQKSTVSLPSTPWLTYTPTVTSATGTLTSASATGQYLPRGNIIFIRIKITVTTNGTGAGYINVTLPSGYAEAGGVSWELNGKEQTTTFKALTGAITATGTAVQIVNYDGTYPAADGYQLVLNGFYQISG